MSKLSDYVWIQEGDSIFKKVGKYAKSRYKDSMKDFGLAPNVIAWAVSTVPKIWYGLYQLTPAGVLQNQITKAKNTAADPNYKHPWYFKRQNEFAAKVDKVGEKLGLRQDTKSKVMYDLWNTAVDWAAGSLLLWPVWWVLSKVPLFAKTPSIIRRWVNMWISMTIPQGTANILEYETPTIPGVQKVAAQESPAPKAWTPTYTMSSWEKFYVNDQWFLSYY